jgi:hypothetical protein
MKTGADKRAHSRHTFTAADIVFSHFNKERSYIAQTMNFGRGGMCFKSNLFLQPGQTVFIRLKKIHPNCSCAGFGEGLRSVSLAEVKWCQKECDTDDTNYGVGVKYVASVY